MLSTCNRTEVYAVAERFHGAFQDIRDLLCDLAQMAPEDLQPHLYSQHDDGGGGPPVRRGRRARLGGAG